jgi:hypothetical protein
VESSDVTFDEAILPFKEEKHTIADELLGALQDRAASEEERVRLAFMVSGSGQLDDPTTQREAYLAPDSEKWKQAEEEELNGIKEAGTYQLVPRPGNKQVIPTRFTYVRKTDERGNVVRHKARLVAKGCCDKRTRQMGWNAFAPTLKLASLRIILAISVLVGATVYQLDIKTAFLNGIMKDEVYVEQPPGYHVGGEDLVWELKKSLYGLNDAPRTWSEALDQQMRSTGFTRILSDPCIYVRWKDNGFTIAGVYVDDILYFSSLQEANEDFLQELTEQYKVKDLGAAKWALGIHVVQSNNKTTISQAQYAKDLANRYGRYLPTRQCTSPFGAVSTQDLAVEAESKSEESMFKEIYMAALGAVTYLACGSRPDLSFPVALLARFAQRPETKHWEALCHVMGYIRDTAESTITYRKGPRMAGFSDASFGTDKEGRSTSGRVVTLAGGAVSWKSARQRRTTTSVCEAELTEMTGTCKEVIWVRNLLEELQVEIQYGPTLIHADNEAAIFLLSTPTSAFRKMI